MERKTFVWNDQKSWSQELWEVLNKYLGTENINEIILEKKKNFEEYEFFLEIGKIVKEQFFYITAFHACKPYNLDYYKLDGIKALNREFFAKITAEAFNKYDLSEEKVLSILNKFEAKNKNYSILDAGYIHLSLSDKCYIDDSHYLIFGGELLFTVLEKHLGGRAYKVLRSVGTPTIISVEIEISRVSDDTMRQIIENCTNQLLEQKIYGEHYQQTERMGFKIFGDIKASQIKRFRTVDVSELHDHWK